MTPFFCTGRYVISNPSSPSFRHESKTHLCSYNQILGKENQKRLRAHSLGRDNMSLFLLVETRNTFNGHVVGLCGSRCDDDIFCVGANQIGNMLEKSLASRRAASTLFPHLSPFLECFLSLPSIRMCSTMGIAILIRKKRQHRIKHPGVNRCCSLLQVLDQVHIPVESSQTCISR